MYTVTKVNDFPRYNTKCSGENEILLGIFRVVSRFAVYFVLYLENCNCFLDSVSECRRGGRHKKDGWKYGKIKQNTFWFFVRSSD